MQKRIITGIAIVIVIGMVIGLLAWSLGYFETSQPSYQIEMAPGEAVSKWDYQSAYTGNAELIAKAEADIRRLEGLLGSGEYPDYTLYVSIANQYGLVGDGKNELAYLEKALALDTETTGLAWHNAGQLFARLGAYATARAALERAAAVQPTSQYKEALAEFMTKYPQQAAQ